MSLFEVSRRSFLKGSGGALGTAWLLSMWPEIVAAAQAAQSDAPASFLTPEEFAEVEAIAAQIVPSGATPGAREARTTQFIDRAFGSFLARDGQRFRDGLKEFSTNCRARYPQAASFAALSAPEQIEYLKSVEKDDFFGVVRFLTIVGLLADPKYGGNHDKLGWKLIGFRDEHVFEPPFGYYDRDYPGYSPTTEKPA